MNRRNRKGPSLATPLLRRLVGTVTTLLVALLAVTGTAGSAQAADGYQYWNYFHLQNGKWVFSQVGASGYKPKDGSVEGFRYGTATQSQGIQPRADLTKVNFTSICGGTKAPAGKKRVALVLDFGVDLGAGKPPAPRGECAVVANDASTQQALDKVAPLRLGSGMVCAIDGYPATGCGEPVKNAEVPAHEPTVAFILPSAKASGAGAATSQQTSQGGATTPWVVGAGVLVVLIAGGALVLNRRSKTA